MKEPIIKSVREFISYLHEHFPGSIVQIPKAVKESVANQDNVAIRVSNKDELPFITHYDINPGRDRFFIMPNETHDGIIKGKRWVDGQLVTNLEGYKYPINIKDTDIYEGYGYAAFEIIKLSALAWKLGFWDGYGKDKSDLNRNGFFFRIKGGNLFQSPSVSFILMQYPKNNQITIDMANIHDAEKQIGYLMRLFHRNVSLSICSECTSSQSHEFRMIDSSFQSQNGNHLYFQLNFDPSAIYLVFKDRIYDSSDLREKWQHNMHLATIIERTRNGRNLFVRSAGEYLSADQEKQRYIQLDGSIVDGSRYSEVDIFKDLALQWYRQNAVWES